MCYTLISNSVTVSVIAQDMIGYYMLCLKILELLYRNKISHVDPLAALIISPTRELAYQTYQVLKKIGQKHDFSAGLVIGGKVSSVVYSS